MPPDSTEVVSVQKYLTWSNKDQVLISGHYSQASMLRGLLLQIFLYKTKIEVSLHMTSISEMHTEIHCSLKTTIPIHDLGATTQETLSCSGSWGLVFTMGQSFISDFKLMPV